MRIRQSIQLHVTLLACVFASLGCQDPDIVFGQREVELELFNDSDDPVHILLDNEARAPSNRIQPGSGRFVITRFLQDGTLFVAAQNNLGVDVSMNCSFVDFEFDDEFPFTGQISYTGIGEVPSCEGSAFK